MCKAHAGTQRVRDTALQNSVHRLAVRAPSADTDPHWPRIALACSCSPTAGQRHSLPVQQERRGFLDQKGQLEAKDLDLNHGASLCPHLGQFVANESERAPVALVPLCPFLQGLWHFGYCLCLKCLACIKEVKCFLSLCSL